MVVATAMGVDVKTVRKWVGRLLAEGSAGLADHSSRPHTLRRPTPPEVVEQIIALRRRRWTGKQIAKQTGTSPATVSRVLRRRV
jgi:transposase